MRKTIPAVALMCAAMMITASCSKPVEKETETSASAASTTVSETTSVPETSETSVTTQATETTSAPSEFKIGLSGKAADKTIVDKNSYYEGEDYVIYFEKDSTVYGDTASRIDSVMHDMEELYGKIGTALKHQFTGATAWIISSNEAAMKCIGLKPSKKIRLLNGELDCQFNKYELFAGKRSETLPHSDLSLSTH